MRFFRPVPRLSLLQVADAETVAGLHARTWMAAGEAVGDRLRAELTPSPAEVRAWLRGGFEVHQASLDSALVGTVRCCFPVSTCYLDRLAVAPEQMGHGFGRYLVEHGLSRARRAGVNRVWTCASPRLEVAVSLFRSLDFRIVARRHLARWDEEMLYLELLL